MRKWWIFVHLLFLSAEDIKERQLFMPAVAGLGASGAADALYMCRKTEWMPGMILLVFGYLSKEKVGYGDGWLVLCMGMWLSLKELLYMLGLGFLLCAVFGAVFGKKELPLVPFLTAAYVLGGFL